MAGRPIAPVVLMLVDGLGYDFVNERNTPNLHKYATSYPMRPLRPVLGYSDTQRAVLFTGLLPDKVGYWMQYRFARPESSPWRWLKSLSPLDGMPGELPRKAFKLGLSAGLLRALARLRHYDDLNIHNIPFRALPWLAPTLRRSIYSPGALGAVPTVFDRLRAAKCAFGIVRSDTVNKLALMRSISSQLARILAQVRRLDESVSFLYLYLHSPDMFAHRHGIRGQRFWNELRECDSAIAAIIEAIRERMGRETQIILTSDHGMNHTQRFVSFQRLVAHPRFGRDFVAALDSTMVRLWYLSTDGGKAARPLVESSGAGRFLTRDERRALGVDFPGNEYGDDVYLLAPGASIYPNFHSLLRPLAMHAYHPSEPDQQAVALFIGDAAAERAARVGRLGMEDILPMLCATLGLDK